jgi:hypothetical protein
MRRTLSLVANTGNAAHPVERNERERREEPSER